MSDAEHGMSITSGPERIAYSVDEAAVRAGIGRDAVYDAIREKRLVARQGDQEAGDHLPAGLHGGPVTDFRPMPREGHADESFVVGGRRFSYSDYSVTPGFSNTRSHGGPIDNGVYVRITHRDNTILRLEIAR
jgi:hypothetical protein